MRFNCKVRIVKRNPALRGSSYYLKSTIALGKETHTENDYFLLHFWNILERGSIKGSQYTKYRLKYNPTKMFTKCLHEGKVTVSFEDPQHDLYIQGNVMELSMFVETLNRCLAGEVGALPSTSSETQDNQDEKQGTFYDAGCFLQGKKKQEEEGNKKEALCRKQ